MQYLTQENEQVDLICWRYYGTEIGTTETVLKANPGLAEQGTHLPARLIVDLPDIIPPTTVKPLIRLWD